MQRLTTFAALILVSLASPALARADDSAVQRRLDAILMGHKVKKVEFGAAVVELPSGRVLYARDAERPMVPASNAKLVVMAAALDKLGPDFQFDTILARRGDDLVVIGAGDPAFGDPRLADARRQPITTAFRRWAEALKAAGLVHFKGRLLFDDSVFDDRFIHPSWPEDQHLTWYEAPIGGLNLADNCVTVTVAPSRPGEPAKVGMTPGNTALTLVNRTKTASPNKTTVNRARGSNQIIVTGTVAKSAELGEITVPDPGLYFAAALRTVLATQGISIAGETVRQRVRGSKGDLPPDLIVIAHHRTPIADVLARAGKQSLGMMAEGLIKRLGFARSGVGSWTAGAAAVSDFVTACGGSPGQFRFDDGSGLSRRNELSPATSVAVLRHMFDHPAREAFMAALSHCGIDGTLDKRMTSIRGRVIGKTGYINGVRTLAGYIHTADDRWLAFAFFYNHASSTRPLTNAQDEACRFLVTSDERASASPAPSRTRKN